MENVTRQDIEKSLFQGQKYHFQGYPDWYNDQLAKQQPIPIDKFKGNMQSAAFFYEKEANKLHFANAVLAAQLKAAQKEKEDLNHLIQTLQGEEKDSAEEKKRRVRRCANEIQRKYVCPVPNCEKSYGTQGSVAQHMRLKHPQISYNLVDLTVIETKPTQKQERKKVKIEDQGHNKQHIKQ